MGYFWYVWKSKKRDLKGVLHEKIKCMANIFKNEKEENYLKRGVTQDGCTSFGILL